MVGSAKNDLLGYHAMQISLQVCSNIPSEYQNKLMTLYGVIFHMRLSFEMIIFYTKFHVFFVNTWNKLYHTINIVKVCLQHHNFLNRQFSKIFNKKDNAHNTGNVHIMQH